MNKVIGKTTGNVTSYDTSVVMHDVICKHTGNVTSYDTSVLMDKVIGKTTDTIRVMIRFMIRMSL